MDPSQASSFLSQTTHDQQTPPSQSQPQSIPSQPSHQQQQQNTVYTTRVFQSDCPINPNTGSTAVISQGNQLECYTKEDANIWNKDFGNKVLAPENFFDFSNKINVGPKNVPPPYGNKTQCPDKEFCQEKSVPLIVKNLNGDC